ncbi:response regulator transcription factor [Aureimonas flava]|uniref:response regulator transcription factor n=1 Tax=Aureimonas flava TaxID=2320271 RepID=UPI0010A97A43|nr:response regulator transcription factor [Aureimonas flava]
MLITDEPFFREGFVGFASRQSRHDLVVAGHAETLEAGRAACRDLHVDIVVVDLAVARGRLGALAGLAAEVAGTASVLVIGARQDDEGLGEILASGVRRYIHKTSDGQAIISAIAEIIEDEAAAPCVLPHGVGPERRADPLPRMVHRVSAREMMVLKRTAFGYSAKEIARELAISQKSVETYKARATAKLGLVSRADIIRYALRTGWFSALLDEGLRSPRGAPPPGGDGPPLRG